MPNTTTLIRSKKIQGTHLGNIGKIDFSSNRKEEYKLSRLLQNVLTPLTKCCQTPIAKSITKCGRFALLSDTSGDIGKNVNLTLTGSGKVRVIGVYYCKNKDCPICGDKAKQNSVESISMAIQEGFLQGATVLLFTGTKAPELDQKLSKQQVQRARSKMRTCVNNYNQRNGTSIGFLHTRETTFSSKQMWTHHLIGDLDKGVRYTHDHSHGIIVIPRVEAHHQKQIIRLLKKTWINVIESNSGKVFDNSIGFRVDTVEGERGLAKYLAKSMSLEIEHGNKKGGKKQGSGYGLGTLLNELPEMEQHDRDEYEELIRQHFISKYRKSETKQNGIMDQLVVQFKERRKKLIHQWFDKNVDCSVERAFGILKIMSGESYNGMVWLESSLSPEKAPEETIVATLDVDVNFWDYVSIKGYSHLITHLFTEYHKFGKCALEYWEMITLLSSRETLAQCRKIAMARRDKKLVPTDWVVIEIDDWLSRCYDNGAIPEYYWKKQN